VEEKENNLLGLTITKIKAYHQKNMEKLEASAWFYTFKRTTQHRE
jgi:hypothetical protein